MKKNLPALLLILLLAMAAQSQTLQNTLWRKYIVPSFPNQYFHFGQDTLSISNDNITYFNAATFTTSADTFKIKDISPVQCGFNYKGVYIFTIQADTLLFTVVSDTCIPRQGLLTLNCYFISLATTIQDLTSDEDISVYPNPSTDGIYNITLGNNRHNKMYVLAADGRKIMEENFSAEKKNYSINLQSHTSGIYFLVMENEKGKKTIKLAR